MITGCHAVSVTSHLSRRGEEKKKLINKLNPAVPEEMNHWQPAESTCQIHFFYIFSLFHLITCRTTFFSSSLVISCLFTPVDDVKVIYNNVSGRGWHFRFKHITLTDSVASWTYVFWFKKNVKAWEKCNLFSSDKWLTWNGRFWVIGKHILI